MAAERTKSFRQVMRGRGAGANPMNRFEHVAHEAVLDDIPEEELLGRPGPQTQFLPDHTRNIIATNDSPDVGFEASVNPYRGCEHGCAYCFARPTHEYLGFSAGIDFETKIMVKYDAPAMLREALLSPRWEPQTLVMSGVTDPYQPIERELKLTRGCLAVLAEFRNPVAIITKNALVARDVDHLAELASHQCAVVNFSVTSLDADLARRLEPRASTPRARLAAIKKLTEAGVPVRVMTAPVVPGLNDHEIPAILKAAAENGATAASYVLLRLPHGVKEIFIDWLDRHEPGKKEKILNRVKAMRGGKLYDSRWGIRGHGEGKWAEELETLFKIAKKRAGLDGAGPQLTEENFHRPLTAQRGQLELF